MIGPSSSHTAGAARIGLISRAVLREEPVSAEILLHGSFAKTYRGHGTDKAIVAGVLGLEPDDPRLRTSLELARQRGVEIKIDTVELDSAHPNTAILTLKSASGKTVTVRGSSIGGGNISVSEINGMAVEISGQHATLVVLHYDAPGTIAAVTEYVSRLGANICNFKLSRAQKGGNAVMTIEVDGGLEQKVEEDVSKLANVASCIMLSAI